MKNNVLVIILVILIGLLSGIALLLGINSSMQMSLAPIHARLNHIEANQKIILEKMQNAESVINTLKGRLGGMPSFNPPAPPQEDFNKVYNLPVGESYVMGKADAPITITDFTDLQCPFCARFYPPLKEIVKMYPDQVKVVIKNFPLSFHPNARPAAKLALAAGAQGKYYEMADLLMNNGADVSEAKVQEYAKTLGLNYDKLMADVKANDAAYEKIIADDMKLGEASDVQGTPTFFINGKKTSARDVEGYKAEIEKILSAK